MENNPKTLKKCSEACIYGQLALDWLLVANILGGIMDEALQVRQL